MSTSVHRGIFLDGQLHREVRVSTRGGAMFVYMWALEPNRRQLIHKGGKP